MIKLSGKVIDKTGFHARPASVACSEAGKYECEISIHYEDKTANLKSIISVMKLQIPYEANIEICFDGLDENEAIEAISLLLEQKSIMKDIRKG